MSVLHVADPVTLWMAYEVPTRMVWRGHRYAVTDTPTPILEDGAYHELITHPTTHRVGWRFQGTSAEEPDDTRMFDIRAAGADRWELVAVYD